MLAVPYSVFTVIKKGKVTGRYAIDCYFTRFLQHTARITTLIKRGDMPLFGEPKHGDLTLEPVIQPDEIEELLKSIFEDLDSNLKAARMERMSHMRRWNLFRMLIPTGHYVHIKKDEDLASVERENQLGLAILRQVLNIKSTEDLDSVSLIPEKSGIYYRISLRSVNRDERRPKDPFGTVVNETGERDPIYSNLLTMDGLFREEFMRLISKKF